MKIKPLLISLLFFISAQLISQEKSYALSVKLTVDENVKESIKPEGRLYVFLTQNPKLEPRKQIWPNPYRRTYVFARNMTSFNPDQVIKIDHTEKWTHTSDWTLDQIPEGKYYIQILWDQDKSESRINVAGNIYGEKVELMMDKKLDLDFKLNKEIEPTSLDKHDLSKMVNFKSDTLSKWWDKPVFLKTSVLLPYQYDKNKSYPIRYNVAGYGGRYHRINRLVSDPDFMTWWNSEESPQIINVFLDGEGPFGDSYQMDSENSGPYGYSLINELIPHIESMYRGTNDAETRFVDGCSTGGWVSLGLQLYYPDTFNGVFSYSPDAIDFEYYQLINIYKDKNAFVNEFGYLRPIMRDVLGEPLLSMKEFVAYENTFGTSNTYLNSGGQFSAHTALYSPKGDNSLPKPLFDPLSGVIDEEVALHWEKYDFKKYAEKHWSEIGPKLQGKIYIWMGDMDHFYLNTGTRGFDDFLKSTQNPKSDAIIEFSAMEGHCSMYSHKVVLLKMKDRLDEISMDSKN